VGYIGQNPSRLQLDPESGGKLAWQLRSILLRANGGRTQRLWLIRNFLRRDDSFGGRFTPMNKEGNCGSVMFRMPRLRESRLARVLVRTLEYRRKENDETVVHKAPHLC